MKLLTFSVSRYRSIIAAEQISIGDMTVLIGRNNEGKSNILKALNTALLAVRHHALRANSRIVRSGRVERRYTTAFGFDWEKDFPVPLQEREVGNRKTRFRIDFQLNDAENAEFQALTDPNNNGSLSVEILLDKEGNAEFSFLKPGKGAKSYSAKSQSICDFIFRKIDFIYVPAVRTENDSVEVIKTRLRKVIDLLEDNPDYRKAVDDIRRIQKPFLDALADEIKEQLVRFIPSVSRIDIDTSERRIYNNLSSNMDITIDDGVATSLDSKGDGIKSLVALSLFNSTPTPDRSRVIAIEEPESHLHSGAVHELRRVLNQLSEDGQVIISTHTAAFVDRQKLSSVILVEKGRAEKAKSIFRIRESLGILVNENLVNADFSIICEGSSDVKILSSILSALSQKIRASIQSGALIFDPLHGSSNLAYKIASLNREVFQTFSILDNDVAGRNAVTDATARGFLAVQDYAVIRLRGAMESEIEDAVPSALLQPVVLEKFGLDISKQPFRGNAKFCGRMKAGFEASGRIWSDELETQLKVVVADFVSERPLERITPVARTFFEGVATSVEAKLRDV